MFKIRILLLVLPTLFLCMAEAKSENIRDTEKQLERYTLGIRLSGTIRKCIKSVQGRIERLEDYLQKLNAEEQETAFFALEICGMPPEQLHKIANNFEYGQNDYYQNKEIAINILYYTYFAHKDQDALHRLRAAGEEIATEPLSKEETEKLEANIKTLEKENEELLKEIKKKQSIAEKELKRIGDELKKLR